MASAGITAVAKAPVGVTGQADDQIPLDDLDPVKLVVVFRPKVAVAGKGIRTVAGNPQSQGAFEFLRHVAIVPCAGKQIGADGSGRDQSGIELGEQFFPGATGEQRSVRQGAAASRFAEMVQNFAHGQCEIENRTPGHQFIERIPPEPGAVQGGLRDRFDPQNMAGEHQFGGTLQGPLHQSAAGAGADQDVWPQAAEVIHGRAGDTGDKGVQDRLGNAAAYDGFPMVQKNRAGDLTINGHPSHQVKGHAAVAGGINRFPGGEQKPNDFAANLN